MKPRTRKQVADALFKARSKAGLSQTELARKAATAGGGMAIAHWETGRRQPNLENFARLCAALDLDPTQTLLSRR